VPAHPWIASRFGRYARIAFVPSITAAIVDHYYRTKRSKRYDFIQIQRVLDARRIRSDQKPDRGNASLPHIRRAMGAHTAGRILDKVTL
jgi:hypothetical protein